MGKQFKFIVNVVCLSTILTGIQNCAPFEPMGLVVDGQGSASQQDLEAADSFSKTLQPTLMTNCAACHDGNTLGAPAFAVPSALSGSQMLLKNGMVNTVAWQTSSVITKLEAGHNGITPAVTSEVSSGVQAWVDDLNADKTAPVARVTSPTGGSVVSGNVMVTATATDNVGVVGVQFLIDGVDAGTEDTTEPYTTSIDTTALANRAYKLTARARDAAGFMATSPIVTVTVNNLTPDVTAPAVAISTPAAGANVMGNVVTTATATDDVKVAGVQFFIDGAMTGPEDLTAPYSYAFDSRTLANGPHIITARARDTSGNMTTSGDRTVNVNNPVPDVEAPTVAVTAPTAGAVLSGATNAMTATAADNVGVVGVTFLVNNVVSGAEDTTAPYSVNLNTTARANGAYTITARARDAGGNVTVSSPVSVTINNVSANPNATFTWISANILVPRCTACHGAARADAGIRYDTYAETIKTALAGNLAGSSLYTSTNSGAMPIGGAKLTAVQLQAIRDWITTGTPNN